MCNNHKQFTTMFIALAIILIISGLYLFAPRGGGGGGAGRGGGGGFRGGSGGGFRGGSARSFSGSGFSGRSSGFSGGRSISRTGPSVSRVSTPAARVTPSISRTPASTAARVHTPGSTTRLSPRRPTTVSSTTGRGPRGTTGSRGRAGTRTPSLTGTRTGRNINRAGARNLAQRQSWHSRDAHRFRRGDFAARSWRGTSWHRWGNNWWWNAGIFFPFFTTGLFLTWGWPSWWWGYDWYLSGYYPPYWSRTIIVNNYGDEDDIEDALESYRTLVEQLRDDIRELIKQNRALTRQLRENNIYVNQSSINSSLLTTTVDDAIDYADQDEARTTLEEYEELVAQLKKTIKQLLEQNKQLIEKIQDKRPETATSNAPHTRKIIAQLRNPVERTLTTAPSDESDDNEEG